MTEPDSCDILFEILCEHLPDRAIFRVDEQGVVCTWNSGCRHFYNKEDNAAIGTSAADFFIKPPLSNALNNALRNGLYQAEWQLKNSTELALVTLQPLYKKGNQCGYALLCQRVLYDKNIGAQLTGQAACIHQDNLFQQLIDHSYSGISLFNAQFNFIYRSPSAARITGFSNNARADISINDMVHPADQPRVKALLDELLQSPGQSRECLFRSRHFNGHFIDLECVFTNWLTEPGIGAIVLNFRDVTEARAADNRLEETMQELAAYKYALDEAAIVAVTDQTGCITHVNDYFCRISGYSREELLGHDHRLINSGWHDKAFIKQLWRTIADGKIWRGELRNRAKDGSYYWVATTIVPFLNEKGKPYQYMAIRFDITAAKAADAQVSNLLESINDGFIALNNQLVYTYVNPRVCAMVGLNAHAMLGRNIWEVFPDAVGSATYNAIEQARATRQPIIHEDYYPPLGLWQENRIYPNEAGLSIFISDITERKMTELRRELLSGIGAIFNRQETMGSSLRQVLEQLRGYADAALAVVWLTSADHDQLYLIAHATDSPDLIQAFDLDQKQRHLGTDTGLPGIVIRSRKVQCWTDLYTHPDVQRRHSAEQTGLNTVMGLPLENGDELIGVLMLAFRKGQPALLSELFIDQLRGQLAAEIKRKQLKRELQHIFENVPDIICIVGADRRFKRINKAMCQLLGYSETELLNKSIDQLIHPAELELSRQRMRRFVTGEAESTYFENRYRTASGQYIDLAWSISQSSEKGIFFCVAKDITEKKQLEELLQKSNELARIGSWALYPQTGNVYWSPVVREVLEVPADYEMAWIKAEKFCPPDELSKINAAIYEVMENGSSFDIEIQVRTAKNQLRWVRVLGEGEFNEGICIRVYGSFQDIDTRKRAEIKLSEQTDELVASGRRYSELFHMSPLPMFVFDVETLRYLDVNQAAVNHYGYSREEFLAMTLRDIRPPAEMSKLDAILGDLQRSKYQFKPGKFTHVKKNGEEIQVEIVSSALQYLDKPARLALAIDVTERNAHLAEIEAQNQKLRDISWMQSHIIRAPLSRLMGLVHLIEDTQPNKAELGEITTYIMASAKELDQVIRDITNNATGGI